CARTTTAWYFDVW
nr:immunoglobulin heavy chain junction region [Mus musculus]MBK4189749.1 immunoglobulin heavy chain junction region [Mus musculus]